MSSLVVVGDATHRREADEQVEPEDQRHDAQELVAEPHRGGHQAQRHEGRREEAQEHARARERLVVDERAGRQQAPVLGREDGQGARVVHREGSEGPVTAPGAAAGPGCSIGAGVIVRSSIGGSRLRVGSPQHAAIGPRRCRSADPERDDAPGPTGAGAAPGMTSCGAAPGGRGRGSRRRRRSPACRGWPPEGLR